MAHRVVVQLVDDLDGREIEDGDGGILRFALDQLGYEIDLSAQHGDELPSALQPIIEKARQVRTTRRRRRPAHCGCRSVAGSVAGDAGVVSARPPVRGLGQPWRATATSRVLQILIRRVDCQDRIAGITGAVGLWDKVALGLVEERGVLVRWPRPVWRGGLGLRTPRDHLDPRPGIGRRRRIRGS